MNREDPAFADEAQTTGTRVSVGVLLDAAAALADADGRIDVASAASSGITVETVLPQGTVADRDPDDVVRYAGVSASFESVGDLDGDGVNDALVSIGYAGASVRGQGRRWLVSGRLLRPSPENRVLFLEPLPFEEE